jgi:phosphoserine phosphatase RsbU/P
VAAERRLVTIENVDSVNVVNPLLVQRGIRSLLGAPLVVGDDTVCATVMAALIGREAVRDDVALLTLRRTP